MTASPALTWTCLFPSDASYECAADSPWVRELIAAHSGEERNVLVVSGKAASSLPDLRSFRGLAAINHRGLSDSMLQQAGFEYVRRFAILPGLHNPRWFVPLDSGKVSAAGFCLSQPSKKLARLIHGCVRSVARAGLPVWYRDGICIAQRTIAPIDQVLQPLFTGQSIRLALSSGSPPPTRNRKISVAVLNADGEILAYAKLPGSTATSRDSVRREAEALAALVRRNVPVNAPRLLWSGDMGKTCMTVASPLAGRPVGSEMTSAHRRYLDHLRSGPIKPASKTEMVASLRERACLLDSRPTIAAIFDRLMRDLATIELPATIVHGDFAPWNLREHGGELAAYDWEYAHIDGLPLIDEIHYLLAVGYLLHGWSAEQAYRKLAEQAASGPINLPSRTVRMLQRTYLVDYLLRLFGEGYEDSYPRVAWCRELLERTSASGTEGSR
jgi:hypothetical protein